MSEIKGVALVTGASSGIGAATAKKLAKNGIQVILAARRLERLLGVKRDIEAEGGKVDVIQVDLTREEDRLTLFNRIKSSFNQLDLLINNAGSGWYGYYADMPWETAREILALNVSASLHLTSLFLPGMKDKGSGHIINIGSIAGNLPNQGVAVYSATKSFLDAFTSALYRESRGSNIQVSIVRAGPVISEFCKTAATRKNGRHLPTEKVGVTAEKVADRIWQLVKKPRKVVYIPGYLRITPWIELSFGWLVDRLGPLLLKYRTR